MDSSQSHSAGAISRSKKPRPHQEVAIQGGNASHARLSLKIFRFLLRGVFRLLFRIRINWREKLPEGPAIICANHLGWADPFLVLLYFPVTPRVYVVGERQVAQISSFRNRALRYLRVMVSLDREKPREALETMQDVLRRGGSILLFPEGHLGNAEGELLELKHGAAHLAAVSNYPLIPVGLTGTSELWLRRRLTMRVGTAITPLDFTGDMRDRIRGMTAALDVAMRELLPGDVKHPRWKPLKRWLTNFL